MEFGGGLGDIFYQMYTEGTYRFLDTLSEQDHARVVLISHNSHARELFLWHPGAHQIALHDLGYWLPEDDARMRREHALPAWRLTYPVRDAPVVFHPSQEDIAFLRPLIETHYLVFSASAGIPDRDLPNGVIEMLVAGAKARNLLPVFVGRSYERHGRHEYHPPEGAGLDLIDQLSVPGVARLLGGAIGLVCCHSAVNMLGWLMRKPQLLLYPELVHERHFVRRDHWAFGANFPECRHTQFDDPQIATLADAFLSEISHDHAPMRVSPPRPRTITWPAECQSIELDERMPRLTSAKEVRFLCWLARRINGNVVEIGCNKGLTTRDLACTNPRKIIYAVDYFAARSRPNDWQRAERPSPDDFCVHAREMENVVVLHSDSGRLNYNALCDVELIFIDGDHTFEGVRADTELARRHLERKHGGWLVWHDYYDDAPFWVGVKRYVDSLDLAVVRVEGTWLALAKIEAASARGSEEPCP